MVDVVGGSDGLEILFEDHALEKHSEHEVLLLVEREEIHTFLECGQLLLGPSGSVKPVQNCLENEVHLGLEGLCVGQEDRQVDV